MHFIYTRDHQAQNFPPKMNCIGFAIVMNNTTFDSNIIVAKIKTKYGQIMTTITNRILKTEVIIEIRILHSKI